MTAVDFEQFPRCPTCQEELELDVNGILFCPINYDHYHRDFMTLDFGE